MPSAVLLDYARQGDTIVVVGIDRPRWRRSDDHYSAI
jgi:hypothetical protein